jgi:hypothetical protein
MRKRVQYSRTITIVTLASVVLILALVPWLIHGRALIQSHQQNQLLNQQAASLAELLATNIHLRALANESTNGVFSTDQFRELLKLRGEIGPLRQSATEAAALITREQKLFASEKELPPTAPPPDPQTVLAYWPKEQLTSAGYAQPAAAIQTMLWAMKQNDPDAIRASLTPETMVTISNHRWVSTPADALIAETRFITESLAPASGFYVLAEDQAPRIPGLNPDFHMFNVYFEKEAATRGFGLKRIDDQWKLEGIYTIGGAGSPSEPGRILWP